MDYTSGDASRDAKQAATRGLPLPPRRRPDSISGDEGGARASPIGRPTTLEKSRSAKAAGGLVGKPKLPPTASGLHPSGISKSALRGFVTDPENELSKALSATMQEMCKDFFVKIGYNAHVAFHLTRYWRDTLEQLVQEPEDGAEERPEAYNSLPGLTDVLCSCIRAKYGPEISQQQTKERMEVWEAAKTAYLKDYRRQDYVELSGMIGDFCELMLEKKNVFEGEVIPHQLSSRAKDYVSLAKKANGAADSLSRKHFNPEKLLSAESADDILHARGLLDEKLVDLAGIRILVYFPDDVPRVVHAIRDVTSIEIEHGQVSFTQSRIDHRDKDNRASAAAKGDGSDGYLDMLNITDGAWLSKPVSLNQVAQRWKHSGYRAVHLHVKLKPTWGLEWGDAGNDRVQAEGTEQAEEVESVDEHDDLNSEQKYNIRRSKLKAKFGKNIANPIMTGKRAEIQITTIVMHAWSEVEHDIIYKNPYGIPQTGTMIRMLDGINGESITSEIMLHELHRTVEHTRMSMNRRFNTHSELLSQLQETYLKDADESTWKAHPEWVKILHSVLKWPDGLRYLTVASLQGFVSDFEAMTGKFPGRHTTSDISVAILKASGLDRSKQLRQSFARNSFHGDDTLSLYHAYNILIFSNSFSIMFAMDAYRLFESLRGHGDMDTAVGKILQINSIVSNAVQNKTSPDANWRETLHGLGKFAKAFITASWCDVHDVAVALAHHCFFITDLYADWSNWATYIGEQAKSPPPEFDDFCCSIEPLNFKGSALLNSYHSALVPVNMGEDGYFPGQFEDSDYDISFCCRVVAVDARYLYPILASLVGND